jgi:carbamoyl-phosphate synthase large subunit
MNILFTSIGKRGYLIEHFREALGHRGKVYAADASKYAPALGLADRAFVIPRADSREYVPALLELCAKYEVTGVLSINDRELPYLAAAKNRLAQIGVTALIADPDIVEVCFDKYQTYQFLGAHGIRVPMTYLCSEVRELVHDLESGRVALPIIAKPRRGSRSVGIYIIEDRAAVVEAMHRTSESRVAENEKHMFQEYIDSDQYSVHVLNDGSLNPVAVVGMVNVSRHMDGETFEIRSVKNPDLLDLGVKLGRSLRHLGSASADVHKMGGAYVVLEINPRISGCYSLSHFANPNYTRNMLAILSGEPMKGGLFEFKENLVMQKQFCVNFAFEEGIAERAEVITGK